MHAQKGLDSTLLLQNANYNYNHRFNLGFGLGLNPKTEIGDWKLNGDFLGMHDSGTYSAIQTSRVDVFGFP